MTATVHAFTPAEGFKKATTAEVKKALVKHFNHKFSVTRGRGTAYHWMHVRWVDGPPEPVVRRFMSIFNDDKNDDMMTDLWCGSQYSGESRDLSVEAFCFMAARVAKKFGLPKPVVRIMNGWNGRPWATIPDEHNARLPEGVSVKPFDYFSDLLHREAYKFDFNKMEEVEA